MNADAVIEDFLAVDNEVITDGALLLAEIVAEISAVEQGDEVSDIEPKDVEEVEVEETVITRQEAQSALNLVRRYVERNFADPNILKHSDALDEAFYQERKNKEQQSKLTDSIQIVD